ncbi:alpha/beta fold hydrolase [Novosphingobium sp.]|uniref:alpha/beta fold hydrolase n=1 Tax=Novosphingobium sp. TaxID=1874826 RepID=UPI0031DF4A62
MHSSTMLSPVYPSFPAAANDTHARLEPTVFLPGLLCDQSLWQNQVEALADVCAPMIANLTLDDTIEAMARRTLAAAPARFSLVGLSMGGYVALEIMRQAPERVTRLALVDTSARADTAERAAQRRAGMESLKRGKFVGITHGLLGNLIHRSQMETQVGSQMRSMASRVGGEAFLRQQNAILNRPDFSAVLPDIAVPTMIVVGDDDRVTPVSHSLEMHEAIAGSTFHLVRECGHMAALERPEDTNALLRDWLEAA